MRQPIFCLLAIAVGMLGMSSLHGGDPKPGQPTPAELKAGLQAYAGFGVKYDVKTHPATGEPVHQILFASGVNDGQMPNLPDLNFQHGWTAGGNPNLTDAALKGIGKRKHLVSLLLYNTAITDAGVKELKHLPNLATLSLSSTKVTDTCLKDLGEMKNLAELHLYSVNVTDAGLKDLKGLAEMRHLILTKTRVTAVGLKELKEMRKLRRLELDSHQITDETLRVLNEIDLLHALPNAQVENKNPANRAEITGFSLWNTVVTDEGLKELKGLNKLRTLKLNDSKITPAGIKEIKDFRELNHLWMSPGQLNDKMLLALMEADQLHCLNDAYGQKFQRPTGAGDVHSLKLSKTPITDAGLKALKNLVNLSNLELEKTAITDKGLEELKALKNLRYLDLVGTKVTPAGLDAFQKAMPRTSIRKQSK